MNYQLEFDFVKKIDYMVKLIRRFEDMGGFSHIDFNKTTPKELIFPMDIVISKRS